MADTYISAMMTNPGTILPQIPIPTILRTLQIHQNYLATSHISNKKHQHHYLSDKTYQMSQLHHNYLIHPILPPKCINKVYMKHNHNRKHTKKHKSRFNHQQICYHTQKKCFKWWRSHVNNETTDPKYEWIQINFISKSHKKKKKHFMNIMKKKHMEQLCLKAVKEECELSYGSRRLKFDFH